MLDAGVHFGHRARHWNPKMAPFIYGERNQLHIIDLEQTVPLYKKTCEFVRSVAAQRGTVLFVGTKRAAQHAIRNEATRCGMPYVSHRWLGGTLTNLKTIKKSIARLEELEALDDETLRERFTKKEALGVKRELAKLMRSLGGIRAMDSLPDAVFIIDLEHERIALNEARKLGIPVAAVVDTNCSPAGRGLHDPRQRRRHPRRGTLCARNRRRDSQGARGNAGNLAGRRRVRGA